MNDRPKRIAGNPILPGRGICDPHVRVFENKAYLYASHDTSIHNPKFIMEDWTIWSSSDLVHWEPKCVLKPERTFIGRAMSDCWATDAAFRNGKYYWYFSEWHDQVGVMVGDSPSGPWKDPLGKPLLSRGVIPTAAYDPGILMDDNGAAYIVFGLWTYYIARLNEDMISLAEAPRALTVHDGIGPYGKGKLDDKPYLHRRGNLYYLSWGCFYATAGNVYGPYTYRGTVIREELIEESFQRPTWPKGILQGRHGSFFEWHNQWYFIYCDISHTGNRYFRDSCISYVHYQDNGDMAPVRLDAVGVGQYDAARGGIEAADYFKAEGVSVGQRTEGGWIIRDIHDGDWLLYPRVHHAPENAALSLRVASGNPEGGVVEIREGGRTGRLIGSCPVPCTGGWETFRTVSCPWRSRPGPLDLCLVFRGHAGELLRLAGLEFVTS